MNEDDLNYRTTNLYLDMIVAVGIAILIVISRAGNSQIIFHFVPFPSKLSYNVYL